MQTVKLTDFKVLVYDLLKCVFPGDVVILPTSAPPADVEDEVRASVAAHPAILL